ncbi:hypothetical protein [Streptomyces sp. A30]|uniref:hypothetical protein n=1 Tax=Streptomyces sp. A30 TaxID=2789273 RepID=UPI00397F2167
MAGDPGDGEGRIITTVIRQDYRWARLHSDAHFACSVCTNCTYDYELDEPG